MLFFPTGKLVNQSAALWLSGLPLSHKSQRFFCGQGLMTPLSTSCFFSERVLIGSPLTGQPAHRTGDVYRCPVGQKKNTGCEKFNLSGERYPSC